MSHVLAVVFVAAIMIASIAFCSQQMEACNAAGGHPVYEYKNMPSCWDAEGRRIFP